MQNDGGEVGAQDFRIGVFRTVDKIRLIVQPEADTRCHPAATTGPLIGTGLGYGFHRQTLDLRSHAVTADSGNPGINDVTNTRDRQRGLSHVRGEHNPSALVGLENPVLLGIAQPRVQRQHLGVPEVDMTQNLAQTPDLALSGQEYQNIAGWLLLAALMLFNFIEGAQNAVGPALIPIVLIPGQRPVTHVYRIGAATYLDHRGLVEELAESLDFDGGRGNDDLQVRTLGQELAQIAEQEIDVETALMGFIDDDRVVAVQKPVMLDLRQQDAVGHHLYPGLLRSVVGKANLIPDLLAGLLSDFLGNAGRHAACGNSARLGMTNQPPDTPAAVHTDFRDLCGFTGTGFPGNDYHLMVFDGLPDIVHPLGNRQTLRKTGRLMQSLSLLNLFQSPFQPLRHFFQVFLPGLSLGTGNGLYNAGGFLLVAGIQLLHHRFDSGFAIGFGCWCAWSIGTGVSH